ncbi:MAG: alpha/beta hydrolase family protein [Kofleriaceae bacterium]
MRALAIVTIAACGSAPRDVPVDGGAGVDAVGELDAAPSAWTTSPACPDAATDIYATQGMAAGVRGSIVKCALGELMSVARVQTELDDSGAERVLATTGVRTVKLAYRTIRSNGTPAISTATIYLPAEPRSLPAPIVLVGRPTAGIADMCAPSRDVLPGPNLALPFAAHGFITITPDFAGLGNEGTHAYLDNHEAVIELFDGADSLHTLLPGLVADPVAAIGYSQGGGVVLSAQALEHAIAGARTLKGIAAIAPQWPISTKSFSYEDVLRNPGRITGLAGLAPPTVTVLRHYGFFTNKMGTLGGDAFPEEERSSIVSSIESLCTIPLGGALDAQQRHLRDLVDPAFAAQVLACIDGTPGCEGNGAAFHQWMTNDFVTADPQGARVMIMQGLADQVMPAAGEAACDVAKLRAEGVEPTVCTDTTATHDSILEKRIEDVVAWIEAVVADAPVPACSSNLPTCNR